MDCVANCEKKQQFASLLLRPLANLLLLGVTVLKLQLDDKYLLLGGEEKTKTLPPRHTRETGVGI